MIRILTLLLASVVLVSPVRADVIYLKNGDRISGEIKEIWDNEITIEPDYSDEFDVDLDDVASIETDSQFDIELFDGREGDYRFNGSDDNGNVVLESDGGQIILAFEDLKRVQEIEEYFEWESKVDLSHSLSKGNANSSTTSLNGSLQFKFGDRRTLLELSSIREKLERETVRDSDRLNISYNWTYKDPWFLAINGSFEQDEIALVDQRISFNPGLGYDIWDEPKRSFNIQFGAGYQSEKINGITSTSSLLNWRLRYSYNFFSDDLELYHNHQLTQTLEENDNNQKNLIFVSSTGIRFDITDDMYLNVELKYDKESEPATGVNGENTVFLVGAGVEFE